ncbi:MAG TPA: ABC transporter permease subunit [Rhodospirillales bacterium]|jgi:NitT/TauT family transport system permease protein/sulfonate transport system permease protein|nr:ABC transporter permease subunit [Rhodospirillales bacterium]MDP7425866.1 ABC transporter permease subunit [Rhodospirillales bacterium]HJO86654.1 ABC transporter permease subunit [Rhodospirillales bacterium]|tara:strand:- start:1081 stop:1884 length:804 start_codon:yes stop_codon:yes gene_type:complete
MAQSEQKYSPVGDLRKQRILSRITADGLVVLAIIGWWLLSLELPSIIFPGPVVVAKQILTFFIDANYIGHVFTSTIRVIIAVLIAVFAGSLLAFLPRWLPVTEVIVHERIKPLLNSFPSVGWAILAIIWFGPSHGTIVFIMVMILTPFCLVNVSEGLKEIDLDLLEMARSFTRRRMVVLVKITLPLLMPFIISAVRIAYGVGWKIALVAELFGTESGLGFLLQQGQSVADAATVFATCFAIVIIFWIGEKLVIDPLSRKFSHDRAGL